MDVREKSPRSAFQTGVIFLGVLAHSLLLIFVTFLWLNLPYTYENESIIISYTSIIKNVILGIEDKPPKGDFLFINTAYQKELIPRLDEFGFELGNEAITDRKALARFFQKVSAQNNHSFIVCDVFLERPSDHDSILLHFVSVTRNVRFPYHRQGEEFAKPVIPVPVAFSDYQTDFGNFLKYTYLQYDTCPSIALLMYQSIDHSTFSKNGLAFRKNKRLALNSFILEFPVRQFDVFRDDSLGYSSMQLQEFLGLPDSLTTEMVRDRIVMVGDFTEADMHQTIYGTTSGPLIHLNAYLNLKENRNNISFWFVAYLFAWYFVFSYVLFFNSKFFTFTWVRKIQDSKMGGFVFDYLKYAFFLLFMSVISYLIFSIHLNVLIISLYFSVVEFVLEFVRQRREKRFKESTI